MVISAEMVKETMVEVEIEEVPEADETTMEGTVRTPRGVTMEVAVLAAIRFPIEQNFQL